MLVRFLYWSRTALGGCLAPALTIMRSPGEDGVRAESRRAGEPPSRARSLSRTPARPNARRAATSERHHRSSSTDPERAVDGQCRRCHSDSGRSQGLISLGPNIERCLIPPVNGAKPAAAAVRHSLPYALAGRESSNAAGPLRTRCTLAILGCGRAPRSRRPCALL
jgi:hypothetical protein